MGKTRTFEHYPLYPVTISEKKTALVLRCPDVRFIGAHKGFINHELDFRGGNYYSLKRAGGVIALARPEEFPEEFVALQNEIRMFLKLHPEISHFIGINHDDCRRYDTLVSRSTSTDTEKQDLLRAAKTSSKLFHKLQFGMYCARFKDDTRQEIYFETVFETDPKNSLRR
jgi:hypothetical protein